MACYGHAPSDSTMATVSGTFAAAVGHHQSGESHKMKKFVHIGIAKGGSTWLQRRLFPMHEQMLVLGRNYSVNVIDDDIRIALWNDLIEAPEFLYDHAATAAHFHRHFEAAKRTRGIRACGVTHEVFTTSWIGDVDLAERARRLAKIFGPETEIVLVVRNQLTTIGTLYCTMAREAGLIRTFEEFLFHFCYDRELSPFPDHLYDKLFETYAGLFGREHVHVIPFEILRRDPQEFADKICVAIGVDPIPVDCSRVNSTSTPRSMGAVLAVNRILRYYLGGDRIARNMGKELKPLYTKRFGIAPPQEITENHKKHCACYEVGTNPAQADVLESRGLVLEPPVHTDLPDHYRDLLHDAYAPHNARLQELSGLDLMQYDYPLPQTKSTESAVPCPKFISHKAGSSEPAGSEWITTADSCDGD